MSEMTHETLRALKQQAHDECEDCWYSCPKSEDYCGEAPRDECRCGMDRRNGELDAHADAWKADIDARNYSARERVRLQAEVAELREALQDALSDLRWAESVDAGTNFHASILRGEHALRLPPAPETPA
jgi:hypothetical protein